MPLKWHLSFLVLLLTQSANGYIVDYLKNLGSYFTLSGDSNGNELEPVGGTDQMIPYEVSIPDQKFISQAIKLAGIQESELDSCQHRIVLKLHKSCHKMNDEELAKMAVALLNCQSKVEGRRIYPCTDTMSIKECTIDMDADTWNTYHLMSNRARAVCYSVRQVQFRGITEQTVNKLMEAARSQITTLGKIAEDQENIQHLAQDTLQTVSVGYKEIASQQQDLQKAQLFGQLSIEDNIKRLADEKVLIAESQEQLSALTRSVHERLEKAADQLQHQSEESRVNHQELLDDMTRIQNMVHVIFQKIEDSSKVLLAQSQLAAEQYDLTLKQLTEVNHTVFSLVNLMNNTRQAIDERLNWITTALGGTDLAVERLYVVLWHVGFLLVSMVACAFLSARSTTRLIIAVIPPLNLGLSLSGNENANDPIKLAVTIAFLISVQSVILLALNLKKNGLPVGALSWKKAADNMEPPSTPKRVSKTPESVFSKSPSIPNGFLETPSKSFSSTYRYDATNLYETAIDEELDDDAFASPTPPLSRNGFYTSSRSRSRTPSSLRILNSKGICHAKTRIGTPCKLSAMPGRDYCHRHQTGDSVVG